MPKIARWPDFPANIRLDLLDRVRDRSVSLAPLDQLRLWIDASPDVPEERLKDFWLRGQSARGDALQLELPGGYFAAVP
jgi:hypothetical protein